MKPEEALNTWQAWRCEFKSRPVIVAELAGGKTNRSFLLEADGNKFVMRLNKPSAVLPGVDRAEEIRNLQAAGGAGIAPRVMHSDLQAGLLITEYIDGTTFGGSNIDSMLIDRLVNLLSRVHSLAIETPAIDYAAHVDAFWRLIEDRQTRPNESLLQRRESMCALVNGLVTADSTIALCHHDPSRSNVIDRNGQLILLDWEYAAPGPVVMDYAALSIEWGIDATEITRRVALNPDMLETAKTVYRYVCQLWSEVQT